MSSRSARYRVCRDVRLRELPELELCLAYVPRRAELYTLDALGWLLVRTCEGRSLRDLARSYAEVMHLEGSDRGGAEIESAMARLMHWGIVEVEPTRTRATTRRAHHAEQD